MAISMKDAYRVMFKEFPDVVGNFHERCLPRDVQGIS